MAWMPCWSASNRKRTCSGSPSLKAGRRGEQPPKKHPKYREFLPRGVSFLRFGVPHPPHQNGRKITDEDTEVGGEGME
ncbi:hypothetical protein GPALN_006392 [Globodera pallida]|nr:hypothetical protein GPALN_006392 [Globodera pallida]